MISIWEKETFFAPQDIIIVGGGFVGLWSAFYLKKTSPKLKITILDGGVIPTGASTRNAGFACFGSLSEIIADAEAVGIDKTLQLIEIRYKGLKRIQKLFGDVSDFELCGGYEIYNDKTISKKLEENTVYLNSLLKPITKTKRTFTLADDKISAFRFKGVHHLVQNRLEGYLHPGKLVQALLQAVQAMGVQVFNSIRVTSFEQKNKGINLVTSGSASFSTTQLLICTNAFANDLIPQSGITPARGQLLVTSPIKNLPWKGAFHFDEGFYYFRNLGNRVLLGGARNKAFTDEATTNMTTSDFIQVELESFLANVILPDHKSEYTIEHRWSGIMGMGNEKVPVVKEVQPYVYSALGTGGMGVALAPIMGEQVSELML